MIFLKKSIEFKEIYQDHKKIYGKYLVILYKNNELAIEKRIGFVVSKKIGKAVIRNKIKRRMKSFCRENGNIIPASRSYILISRKEAANAQWNELKSDLINTFSQTNNNAHN